MTKIRQENPGHGLHAMSLNFEPNGESEPHRLL